MTDNHIISDHFDHLCAVEGSRVAIREVNRDLTFRELLRRSHAISRGLEPILREPGQRVALILPNSAAFVSAFFGIARVGVVAPLSVQYRSKEFAYYLRDLEAAAAVTEARFIEPMLEIISMLDIKPAVFKISADGNVHLVRPGAGTGRPVPSNGSPPLLQQYTSGSTGTPKRVIRTHGALLAEVEALRKTFGIDERDRFLGAAPFSHVNGLVRTMMTSMYVGGTLYPVEGFHRREILNLLTRERITFFGGVPQMFTILSETPLRGDIDLSTLRVVFSSSAPLTVADNQRFQSRYGVFVRQVYGSTETGTISFNSHESPDRCLKSVGLPIDGVRVEVVDEKGVSLPAGHEGEFVIASPFAASGYWGNIAATEESFRGGFYLSGDFGIKDEKGYLTINGRKKLMINRGGFKVNPYEVEEIIRQHPKVANVAVFGTLGPHRDDIVCCFIVASGNCTVEEIISHCHGKIADFKVPTRIEFRDELPISPTGKILRANLCIERSKM